MIKNDILFTGYYGQQNTGDDAFIEVASWGADKYWQKRNIRFLSKVKKLPIVRLSIRGYPFSIPKSYAWQAKALLNNTNSFIYAGGSTIHTQLNKSNVRYKAYIKKQGDKGFKYGAIGVSVGPFKSSNDESAVQSYLKQMDFLAVRDQASYDIVSEWDLPYEPINAFDLAALLPEVYDYKFPAITNKIKTIGISVCPYESHQINLDASNEIKRNKMFIELIRELNRLDNFHFIFYVINGNTSKGDLELTKETIQKSRPNSFEISQYNRTTEMTWKSIAQCDFMISTRLHGAIFACFAEVPFMLNEYHRKCGDFLNNIGYNPEYRLFNSEYNVKEKAIQIAALVNDQEKYIKPKFTSEMIEKARLNFTKINL